MLSPYMSPDEVQRLLRQVCESGKCVVHYAVRNSGTGGEPYTHGVADRGLARAYSWVLDLAYRRLPLLGWPTPPRDSTRKLHAWVCDMRALFYPAPLGLMYPVGGVPSILLECGSTEPSLDVQSQRARAVAVHEMAHAFTYSQQDPGVFGKPGDPWWWFDEATAVFAQTYVLPDNPNYLGHMRAWSDKPEMSLDSDAARYWAGMFVGYLERRIPRSLARCWAVARTPGSAPLSALESLFAPTTPAGRRFGPFADATRPDFFASRYCVDGYFLADPASPLFSPAVYERHGERLLSASWQPGPGRTGPLGRYSLDHLACRYFRFQPRADTRSLTIAVTVPGFVPEDVPLKAELWPVTTQFSRGRKAAVASTRALPAGGTEVRLGPLERFTSSRLDHAVLIVTNCTYGAKAVDGVEFDVTCEVT